MPVNLYYTQKVRGFQHISYRKFQAQRRYEFMSQTVEEAYHARMAFHRWCKLAEETGIPELKTMARTIRDKLDGIVTYWTFRHISNAKMEGFNNKIRWLIKQTLRLQKP